MSSWRPARLLIGVTLILSGCGGEIDAPDGEVGADVDVGRHDGSGREPVVRPRNFQIIPNPSNSLSRYVEWKTARPTTTDLAVECGDWRRTYTSSVRRTEHEVFIAGLWRGASCRVSAGGRLPRGELEAETARFEVSSIPDFLPALDVSIPRESGKQRGWTLVNLSNAFDSVPLTVAVFDSRGRYRWYHQLSTSHSGSDTEVRVFQGGVLVGGNRHYIEPRWIDWQGDVLWRDDFRMHHDIRPDDGGEAFLYLSNQADCPELTYDGGAIKRYDRSSGTTTDSWPLCEFFQPPKKEGDWAHMNTLERVPGEEAVILSSRTQHTLFKVDLADRELDWKMGIEGDFGLSGNERFFRQHAVEVLDNGNLLMFDNGSLRRGEFSRPWSRALEISYDAGEESAEVVWSYRPDPDLFAPIWGDADRLENGHTLVTFGLRNQDDTKNSRIVEVTEKGEVVWRVEAPNKWGWYRSDRLDERPVGRVLTSDGS